MCERQSAAMWEWRPVERTCLVLAPQVATELRRAAEAAESLAQWDAQRHRCAAAKLRSWAASYVCSGAGV